MATRGQSTPVNLSIISASPRFEFYYSVKTLLRWILKLFSHLNIALYLFHSQLTLHLRLLIFTTGISLGIGCLAVPFYGTSVNWSNYFCNVKINYFYSIIVLNLNCKHPGNLIPPWYNLIYVNISTGQREVLPYIRSVHDPLVPWRKNRNCAFLHHGVLWLCSLHDQRWDGKFQQCVYTSDYSATHDWILFQYANPCLFVCHVSFLFLPGHCRERSAIGCSKWQQRNIKTCTDWQWWDRESIDTFSVSMLFPNTWEKIHHSLRRYQLLVKAFIGWWFLKL